MAEIKKKKNRHMRSLLSNSQSNTFLCISVLVLYSTSEIFLSVSFLLSSIFLSMPTIPTARVLPAYTTMKERKTRVSKHTGEDKQ